MLEFIPDDLLSTGALTENQARE
jgi:hypothetical protein